jgi:glycosyltransferase involved in cell wall biosynthesis
VNASPASELVSVIIPARNEAHRIGATVRAVVTQATRPVEVLVADDGSSDATSEEAEKAGARVLALGGRGNPGAARNSAARAAKGSILLFLDADCVPRPDWLGAHLRAQQSGMSIVGGAMALPLHLPWTARADYYASAYHVHPERKPGLVPNHSPANLSVERAVFGGTHGFTERFPVADGHEELAWQSEAKRNGARIYFEPAAVVEHWNRGGVGNLLRRSYRWGLSALESKATNDASRLSAWYRIPLLGILLAYPLALAETLYITGTWLGAGKWEVMQFVPLILASRVAYASAFIVGGFAWYLRGKDSPGRPPRWR